MPKLPAISGAALIEVLQKDDFVIVHRKGSHVSLKKGSYKTVVPLHQELAKGTLSAILR